MKDHKIVSTLDQTPQTRDAERQQIIHLGKLLLGCRNIQTLTLIFVFLKLKISLNILLPSCFTTLTLLCNENKLIAIQALDLIPDLQTAIFNPPSTHVLEIEKLQLTALLCIESIAYVI
jgi:hypothetical protein